MDAVPLAAVGGVVAACVLAQALSGGGRRAAGGRADTLVATRNRELSALGRSFAASRGYGEPEGTDWAEYGQRVEEGIRSGHDPGPPGGVVEDLSPRHTSPTPAAPRYRLTPVVRGHLPRELQGTYLPPTGRGAAPRPRARLYRARGGAVAADLSARAVELFGRATPSPDFYGFITPAGDLVPLRRRAEHADVADAILGRRQAADAYTALRDLMQRGFVRVTGQRSQGRAELDMAFAVPMTAAQEGAARRLVASTDTVYIEVLSGGRGGARFGLAGSFIGRDLAGDRLRALEQAQEAARAAA